MHSHLFPRIATAAITLTLIFGASGCGSANDAQDATAPATSTISATAGVTVTAPSPAASATTTPTAEPHQEDVMKVSVSDGTHEIVFALNDSSAAQSLYAALPFDVDVSNYSTNEKIFYPPTDVTIAGDGPQVSGGAGDLALFSPWGNVVMYYGDYSQYPGLYKLGEAESGADQIPALSGTARVDTYTG